MGIITDEGEIKMAKFDKWLEEEALPEQREEYIRVQIREWPKDVPWGAGNAEIAKREPLRQAWLSRLRMICEDWEAYCAKYQRM